MYNIDKIGFLLISDDFYFYRNIFEYLPRESFEVVIIDQGHETLVEKTELLCSQAGIDFRHSSKCLELGQRYRGLVSHQTIYGEDFKTLRALGALQIRYLYGLGYDNYHFADWNRNYDVILCYGPYQCTKLSFCENSMCIEIGYPRYDDFFRRPELKHETISALGLDPSRRTVLWTPTWSESCSIDRYAAPISALSDRYNVVVKPHPSTVSNEPQRMALLHSLPFTKVVTASADLVDLFRITDFVCADYGGTQFGALSHDKNILLFDVPAANSSQWIGSESSEYLMRNKLGVFTDQPGVAEQLHHLLDDSSHWENQRKVRAELRSMFFAPYYGNSGRIAATVLAGITRVNYSTKTVI